MKPALPLLALLAPTLGALAGCRSAAPGYTPTPPAPVAKTTLDVKDAGELMPLDVGNQWNYDMRIERTEGGKPAGSNDVKVAYRVDSKNDDGSALLVMEQDGQVVDRQDWLAEPKGLYQLTGGAERTAYTPAQPLAPLPLVAGKTFRWSGKGMMANGKVSQGDARSEVLDAQTVDTGMGPLSAIPVRTLTSFSGGKSSSTAWFRPGVGLVRYRQEALDATGRLDVITLTLSSYAAKKR